MILHWVYPVGVVAVLVDPQGFGFDPVAFGPEEAEAVVDSVSYFHHSHPDHFRRGVQYRVDLGYGRSG